MTSVVSVFSSTLKSVKFVPLLVITGASLTFVTLTMTTSMASSWGLWLSWTVTMMS